MISLRKLSVFFIIIVFLSLIAAKAESSYFAFSLREAVNHAREGNFSDELRHLAGITRFAGLVYDHNRQDIILVGLADSNLPKARFEDFCVALRARLIYDEFPLVSIDPVKDTEKTNLQKIRFDGHLENSYFGKNFLICDILLKLYSLGMIDIVPSVPSYNLLIEQDIKNNIRKSGADVIGIHWHAAEEENKLTKNYYAKPVASSELYQARFWFYAMEPYTTVNKEEVFCIKELKIGVESEILYQDSGASHHTARELFAKKWNDNFSEVCSKHPQLKILKVLDDFVAVANAIKSIEHQPYLEYLLNEYPISYISTKPDYKLEEIYGVVERSDGLKQLIKISGGIEFRSEVKFLNYGDVTPLRKIVIDSRPSQDELSWPLPLSGWKMPNAKDLRLLIEKPRTWAVQFLSRKNEGNGCFVSFQSVIINPTIKIDNDSKKFYGFSPLIPPPPLKGVSMRMVVDEESFKSDPEGQMENLREKILKSRPSSGSLSWPSP